MLPYFTSSNRCVILWKGLHAFDLFRRFALTSLPPSSTHHHLQKAIIFLLQMTASWSGPCTVTSNDHIMIWNGNWSKEYQYKHLKKQKILASLTLFHPTWKWGPKRNRADQICLLLAADFKWQNRKFDFTMAGWNCCKLCSTHTLKYLGAICSRRMLIRFFCFYICSFVFWSDIATKIQIGRSPSTNGAPVLALKKIVSTQIPIPY